MPLVLSANRDDEFKSSYDNTVMPSTRRTEPVPLSKDKTNTLTQWAEPGPSTPSKRVTAQEENWDDDFRDNSDSPVRRRSNAQVEEVENWDDDFEEARAGDSPKGSRFHRHRASWGSSDEEDDEYGFADREEDRTVTPRTRTNPLNVPANIHLPPVPPLPSSFPRSPAASVFSVPASTAGGRDSIAGHSYSSGSHVPLRPTLSSSSSHARLALLPPSPPIHRERRRLRKKSRPPPHLEDNIYELDDHSEVPILPQPSTPEQRIRPLETLLDDSPPTEPKASASKPNGTKAPLLSRIGSVGKKWGTSRKKRSSTGPLDVVRQEHGERSLDQPLPSSPSSKSSWFFRSGGGGHGPGSPPVQQAALKHENSIDKLFRRTGTEREVGSPSLRSKTLAGEQGRVVGGQSLPVDLQDVLNGEDLPSPSLIFGAPRRPMSMQVFENQSDKRSSRPPAARHASYGQQSVRRPASRSSRSSSKHRSASASVEDVHRQNRSALSSAEGSDERLQDSPLDGRVLSGGRSFMGGMRRVSLVGTGKHKRTKSSAPLDPPEQHLPTAPSIYDEDTVIDQTTPRPPSRVIRRSGDELLPPIELEPPSPPRSVKPRISGRRPRTAGNHHEFVDNVQLDRPALELGHSQLAVKSDGGTFVEKSTLNCSVKHPARASSPLPSPTRAKPSSSPQQSASLGRATQLPKEHEPNSTLFVPRRNSLGDLKIPARISQAQVGLRRDLGLVREFATSVERV